MCSEDALGDLSRLETSQGRNSQKFMISVHTCIVFVRMLYVASVLLICSEDAVGDVSA